MITITKEFNWPMSHRLENHKGACNNLHGHNYKLLVTASRNGKVKSGGALHDEGMVMDFSDLKLVVNRYIVEKFDHAFVFNKDDRDSLSIAKVLQGQINQKILMLPFRTTAENMVKWIVEEINKHLDSNIRCVKAVLYETETSYTTYEITK